MSATAADRRHVRDIEFALEARVVEQEEERDLRKCQACLARACKAHAALDGILHELTGSLDHGDVEQSALFPVVDVSRKVRAS